VDVLLLYIGIYPIAALNLNFFYISCAKGSSYQFYKNVSINLENPTDETMENRLELTNDSTEENVTELSAALKNLKPEEKILIKAKGDFDAVMTSFQTQNWGKYDWLPLSISSEEWSGYLIAKPGGFTSIVQIMESHHRHCDSTYVHAENVLGEGKNDLGKELMRSFIWNMELHFAREETILFPAFEEKTGMTSGPTQVMRVEHEQIRGVLKEVSDCLNEGNWQRIFDLSEAMLILIAQHNSKEENVLYPATDQYLDREADDIARKLQLLKQI
jgi:hemerythrin-like domain-containing protein